MDSFEETTDNLVDEDSSDDNTEHLFKKQSCLEDPSMGEDGYREHDTSNKTAINLPSTSSLYQLPNHQSNQIASGNDHRPEIITSDEDMIMSDQTSSNECKDSDNDENSLNQSHSYSDSYSAVKTTYSFNDDDDKKSQLIAWKRYSGNATKESTITTFLYTLQALANQFKCPFEAAAHIENTLNSNSISLNRHNYQALDATIKILTGSSCIQFHHHIGNGSCRIGIIPNLRDFNHFISFYTTFLNRLYPLIGSIHRQYWKTHKSSIYVMKFTSVQHMWQIIHFLYHTVHAKIFMLNAAIEYCFDTASDFYFDEQYIIKVIHASVITYELFVHKGGYLRPVISNLQLCCVKQRCNLTCMIDRLIDSLEKIESYLPNLYTQPTAVKMSNPDLRQVMIDHNLLGKYESKALLYNILN